MLQLEGKQMFSCPVIIVEALENITNFVSVLKRYLIKPLLTDNISCNELILLILDNVILEH